VGTAKLIFWHALAVVRKRSDQKTNTPNRRHLVADRQICAYRVYPYAIEKNGSTQRTPTSFSRIDLQESRRQDENRLA